MENSHLKELLAHFRNIHFGHNWFGQSYLVKLRDLPEEHYFERPYPNIHAVAELLAHSTAWRKDAMVKIRTGKGELTEASINDWQDLDKLKKDGWKTIFAQYQQSVSELVELLKEKDDAFLQEYYHDPEFAGDFPYSFTINGILQHDIYHLGQIGLVIKMLKEKGLG